MQDSQLSECDQSGVPEDQETSTTRKKENKQSDNNKLIQNNSLTFNDKHQRAEFCEWLLDSRDANILFTGERTFTPGGLHSTHYWAHEDHNQVRTVDDLPRYTVYVWAGLVNTKLIGPVYLPQLNTECYLDFLKTVLPDLLDELPLDIYCGEFYYQHDGSPAHTSRQIREYLNEEYGDRWIGRGGPVEWPAKSPDLTPLEFYVWDQIKDIVYKKEPEDETDLKNKLETAFTRVKHNIYNLSQAQRDLRKRARLCLVKDGERFKV